MPWLTWRSRAMASLYAELNAAAQETVPGAVLSVVTPGLDGGPAGAEARRVDLAGLTPGQAWRSVGLDLTSWPDGPIGPAVLRGVALSSDALAHDLATSPDLDAIVAGRPRRGMLLTIDGAVAGGAAGVDAARRRHPPARRRHPRGPSIRLSALPLGDASAADEPLGHALAALDAQWVFLAAGAAAGHEERLRRFAVALRALPAWPTSPTGPVGRPPGAPLRHGGAQLGRRHPELPGHRQRLALSDPPGVPAGGPRVRGGRGPRPGLSTGPRRPSPADGTSSSTCSRSASRRSAWRRRASASRR